MHCHNGLNDTGEERDQTLWKKFERSVVDVVSTEVFLGIILKKSEAEEVRKTNLGRSRGVYFVMHCS